MEQARSAVEASIKVDISRPDWQEQLNDRAEARWQGTVYVRPFLHSVSTSGPAETLGLLQLLNMDSGTNLCECASQDV